MESSKRLIPKIEKWTRHVEVLEHQVMSLHHNRAVWRAMVGALEQQADDNSGVFLDHYTKLYVDASVIAVRRLASDTDDSRSNSLGRLLTEIAENCDMLTREGFVERQAGTAPREQWQWRESRQDAEREWTLLGGDGDALDSGRVVADLDRLRSTAATVSAFADRAIAHIDKRGVNVQPTFKELDEAIEIVGDILGRYSVLIRGVRMAFYEPVIQQDWRSPFRRPVFTPRD